MGMLFFVLEEGWGASVLHIEVHHIVSSRERGTIQLGFGHLPTGLVSSTQ